MNALDELMAEFEAHTMVIDMDDLNPMQRRAVEDFRRANILPWQEAKKFEITRTFGGTYVYVVVGVPGDEGTAALVVRRYYHFVVGPRGKIKMLSED